MTASASKNKITEPSVMTPAAGKISEAVLLLMQLYGICKIECRKLKSSDFERIVASVSNFPGTPTEMMGCGLLVKDSLAEILASAGIVGLEITATEEEKTLLKQSYDSLVATYKASENGDAEEAKTSQLSEEKTAAATNNEKTSEKPDDKKCHGKSCSRKKS